MPASGTTGSGASKSLPSEEKFAPLPIDWEGGSITGVARAQHPCPALIPETASHRTLNQGHDVSDAKDKAPDEN